MIEIMIGPLLAGVVGGLVNYAPPPCGCRRGKKHNSLA